MKKEKLKEITLAFVLLLSFFISLAIMFLECKVDKVDTKMEYLQRNK